MKRMFVVLGVLGVIMIVTCAALGASPMVYLLCVGIPVLVGVFVAPLFKQADEMLASGAIVTRDADFMNNIHIFTLAKVSMESLISAMKNEGLPFSGLEWKTGTDIMAFKYSDWTAQLVRLNDSEDFDMFEFGFLQWQTNKYGGSVTVTQMNQLLTAIEKAFIGLDSNTRVKTERGKVTSKTSFF